jgi:hypothetical protein
VIDRGLTNIDKSETIDLDSCKVGTLRPQLTEFPSNNAVFIKNRYQSEPRIEGCIPVLVLKVTLTSDPPLFVLSRSVTGVF